MRILNIEGEYFVRALRELGHDVLTVGQGAGADIRAPTVLSLRALLRALEAHSFQPDLALWCDQCRPPLVLGLESLPCVTIGYSIDQYCNPWHVPFSAGFDLFLVAQLDHLPLFQDSRLQRQARWLPLFCDPWRDRDPMGERDIPASFVGSPDPPLNRARKPFLEAFRHRAPLFSTRGDYAPIFGRSRLVLNQSAIGELNFRVFETMACGAALLTEDCAPGLAELFIPGEHLFVYRRGDPADAARQARLALADPGRLAQVAARGRDMTRKTHSRLARARHIAAMATEMLRAGRARWRMQHAALVREESARACAMLAADADLPLPGELRGHFLRQAGMLARI